MQDLIRQYRDQLAVIEEKLTVARLALHGGTGCRGDLVKRLHCLENEQLELRLAIHEMTQYT